MVSWWPGTWQRLENPYLRLKLVLAVFTLIAPRRWPIWKSAQRIKKCYDKTRKVATTYKTGDLVLYRIGATKMADLVLWGKFANWFEEPYRVCQAIAYDRYVFVVIKGIRSYKRFKIVAAVDSLRRFQAAGDENVVAYDNILMTAKGCCRVCHGGDINEKSNAACRNCSRRKSLYL